jgi:hypothetical protein
MISQLNNSNAAFQRSQAGTLLGRLSPAGYVFYVDQNAGDDDNDGSSWGSAFQTLSFALAASTTAIASGAFGWAAKNVIYAKGDPSGTDSFVEDLVLLAPKTDIIGVGSWDRFPYAGLKGNHIPVGTTCSYGTRFFNFKFMGDATTGGDIWTLTNATAGLEFHNCLFDGKSTTAATGAIVCPVTPPEHLKIIDSQFLGVFSDSVIEIAGTGSARGLLIKGNHIEGGDVGIEIGASVTASSGATLEAMFIEDNRIVTTKESILDSAGLAYITGNKCFSGNAKGTTGFGVITGTLARGQDNRITGSDVNNAVWPAQGSL